jgi:hypothetical protein
MRRAILFGATAATWVLASCKTHRQEGTPGFAVTSRNFDVSPLVGEWKGEFVNVELGRKGTIAFALAAREEKAMGEVVLMSMNPTADTLRSSVVAGAAPAPSAKQVVKISFVRIEGDNVVGRTESYVHPACNCRVSSTFRGVLHGGQIDGTYVVVSSADPTVRFTGNWNVKRVKRL